MPTRHNFPVGTQLGTTIFGKVTVVERPTHSQYPEDAIAISKGGGVDTYVYPDEVESVLVQATPEAPSAEAFNTVVAPSAEAFNIAVAKVATEFNRQIGFGYTKSDGEYTDRVLEVEHVIEGSKGTLIVGRDTEADDWRAFRVDRIDGEVELY